MESKRRTAEKLQKFRMPRYAELPNMGLYLEQTTKYISGHLEPVLEGAITASMISNYVKKGLIENPVKKQYSREQIAYLFFIAVAKKVLSLDALQNFINLQKRTYTPERAYNYFVEEFENLLFVGTGALMSPVSIFQGEVIPAVAHAVHIGR